MSRPSLPGPNTFSLTVLGAFVTLTCFLCLPVVFAYRQPSRSELGNQHIQACTVGQGVSPGAPEELVKNGGQSALIAPTFNLTAITYLNSLHHGRSYDWGEEVHRRGLSKRRWYLAVSDMSETWKRELVLFARLLQKELGRLPCALVRYTCPRSFVQVADPLSVGAQVCAQIWLYVS